MLNKFAFAHSIAIITAGFYIIIYGLRFVSPRLSEFVFNAQFLGANLAQFFPRLSFVTFLGILAVVTITSWAFGYLWAGLYNYFAKG